MSTVFAGDGFWDSVKEWDRKYNSRDYRGKDNYAL